MVSKLKQLQCISYFMFPYLYGIIPCIIYNIAIDWIPICSKSFISFVEEINDRFTITHYYFFKRRKIYHKSSLTHKLCEYACNLGISFLLVLITFRPHVFNHKTIYFSSCFCIALHSFICTLLNFALEIVQFCCNSVVQTIVSIYSRLRKYFIILLDHRFASFLDIWC